MPSGVSIADADQDLGRTVEELERKLGEALEQQTATSELIKVIGRSTFDLLPVYETLAENAVRLCEAERAVILRFDGRLLRAVAAHNFIPEMKAFLELNPIAPGRESGAGRAAVERRTIHIHDIQTDPEYTYYATMEVPLRTVLAIPMLRANQLLGVIAINRHEVRPFSDNQIALMESFADQAAIAIENVRVLNELQARTAELTRSVQELQALSEVSQALSSTLDLETVLDTIVSRANQLAGTESCSVYEYDEATGEFLMRATNSLNEELIRIARKTPIRRGEGVQGRMAVTRKPIQIPDITSEDAYHGPLRDVLLHTGTRALLAVPLLLDDHLVGGLTVNKKTAGEFSSEIVDVLKTFASQAALAIQNARLFREIEDKGRQLEITSQHKSQFVANMSHELRTPLAAILGYAELMQEGFYGAPSTKSMEALTRIRSNGKHLLGLINAVLDIAKIESGQFSLNLAEYAIESVVETVRAATESLAATKKLAIKTDVFMRLPVGLGDEQRLTQVLLNLVGNAIKFTDAGEVRVTATAVNGHFTVAVSDTGPGIPPEELERVFEQFHQIDNSNTKAKGGTGLGLAIAKQIVEMHGGRIWVESTVGNGATFQMELPIRTETNKGAA